MRVEKAFDKNDMPAFTRRPRGQVGVGATKKGNKKRGLRGHLVSLLDEEDGAEDEDEEDRWPLDGSVPPALIVHLPPCRVVGENYKNV